MPEHERLMVMDYEHWSVYLHRNQYFLGRVYIWSKRAKFVDLMNATEEEREELFSIGKRVRDAITSVFAPDLFNWASLGNLSRQCHMHVIPRYASLRIVAGVHFNDARWGKNYAPYDYDFTISEPAMLEIRESIANALRKQQIKCKECGGKAGWVRRTHDNGDSFFCEADARREEDFGQEDPSMFIWEQLPCPASNLV